MLQSALLVHCMSPRAEIALSLKLYLFFWSGGKKIQPNKKSNPCGKYCNTFTEIPILQHLYRNPHGTRRGRNQHSLFFQIPSASKDVYQYIFFPQTIRDWNDLPESLISSSELSDDSVSKFTSLVRARD